MEKELRPLPTDEHFGRQARRVIIGDANGPQAHSVAARLVCRQMCPQPTAGTDHVVIEKDQQITGGNPESCVARPWQPAVLLYKHPQAGSGIKLPQRLLGIICSAVNHDDDLVV